MQKLKPKVFVLFLALKVCLGQITGSVTRRSALCPVEHGYCCVGSHDDKHRLPCGSRLAELGAVHVTLATPSKDRLRCTHSLPCAPRTQMATRSVGRWAS